MNLLGHSEQRSKKKKGEPAAATVVGFVTSTTAMDLHRMFKPVVP